MGRRHVSTTCYLDEDQVLKLRQLSEVTKVPVAEWVRQGIDLVLAEVDPAGEVISPREEPDERRGI